MSSLRRQRSHTGDGPGGPVVALGAVLGTTLAVGALATEISNLLWAALAVAGLLLLLRFRRPLPLTVNLFDVWLLAFLVMYVPEAAEYATGGDALIDQAGSFTAGAFGATLVGYWLAAQLQRRSNNTYGMGRLPAPETARPRAPGAVQLVVIALSLIGAYYVVVELGTAGLFAGRGERYLDRGFGFTDNAGILVLTLLPILAAYLGRRYDHGPIIRWVVYALGVAALLALVALGTRFFLGFATVGSLYFFMGRFAGVLKGKVLLMVGLLGVLLPLQALILETRTEGASALLRALSKADGQSQPLTLRMRPEGLLNVTAQILSEPQVWGRTLPLENLYLVYWWIPRRVWPEKPTMAGYWIIREYGDSRGFGTTHSVSGGFCMAALVDFGPKWGVVFCLVYGGLLSLLERFALADRRRSWSAPSIAAALLYFCVFFMMRSLQTSFIFFMSAFVTVVLPLVMAESLGLPRGPGRHSWGGRRPRQPAIAGA